MLAAPAYHSAINRNRLVWFNVLDNLYSLAARTLQRRRQVLRYQLPVTVYVCLTRHFYTKPNNLNPLMNRRNGHVNFRLQRPRQFLLMHVLLVLGFQRRFGLLCAGL